VDSRCLPFKRNPGERCAAKADFWRPGVVTGDARAPPFDDGSRDGWSRWKELPVETRAAP
jgi:hypothetical protein